MKAGVPTPQHIVGIRNLKGLLEGGYDKFLGLSMGKSWTEFFQLEIFLNTFLFNTIVELNTGNGVNTVFMGLHGILKKIKIYTFDNHPPDSTAEDFFHKLDVLYYTKDIFTPEAIEQITARLQRNGKTLLYCKGNDKRKKVETFGPKLKKDDVILIYNADNEIDLDAMRYFSSNLGLEVLEKEWFDKFTSAYIAFVRK